MERDTRIKKKVYEILVNKFIQGLMADNSGVVNVRTYDGSEYAVVTADRDKTICLVLRIDKDLPGAEVFTDLKPENYPPTIAAEYRGTLIKRALTAANQIMTETLDYVNRDDMPITEIRDATIQIEELLKTFLKKRGD